MTDPVRERCGLLVEKGEAADVDKLKEARKILIKNAAPTVIGALSKSSDDSKK